MSIHDHARLNPWQVSAAVLMTQRKRACEPLSTDPEWCVVHGRRLTHHCNLGPSPLQKLLIDAHAESRAQRATIRNLLQGLRNASRCGPTRGSSR